MNLTFIYLLAYGFFTSLFGVLIGWMLQLPKLRNYQSEIEIKQDSYLALKRQYDTHISKYEPLYRQNLNLEEEKKQLAIRITSLEAELEQSDKRSQQGIIDEDIMAQLDQLEKLNQRAESKKKKNKRPRQIKA